MALLKPDQAKEISFMAARLQPATMGASEAQT